MFDKTSMKRARLGANQAFIADDPNSFFYIDEGYVDLFAVLLVEGQTARTRKPFLCRMNAGGVFFGTAPRPVVNPARPGFTFAFMVVPSLDTILYRGKREQLASRDSFDLDAVTLIDDYVMELTNFISTFEPQTPIETQLLEADPDVPYPAGSEVSSHHLEVLWVSVDRPAHYLGLTQIAISRDTLIPLTERTWLTLPEDAQVSATHSPGAIVRGLLWTALDQWHDVVLACAEYYWLRTHQDTEVQKIERRQFYENVQSDMFERLASAVRKPPAPYASTASQPTSLQAVAAIVAASVGARLDESSLPHEEADPLDAVGGVVAASGIRTRRIELQPGWERRDGPSFVGVTADEEANPVAVVNTGRGAYYVIDPVSGEYAPVDGSRAKSIQARGEMLYAPLARSVDSGLAALRQALRGHGRDIAGVILTGLLGAIAALLTPILTGQLLAEIIPRVDVPMWTAALAALAVGAFASAAVSAVGAFSLLRIEARIDENLQTAVWNRLLSLPLPFFRRYLAGDLADRANGVTAIRQMLTGATSSSIVSGVFSIFSYALLFYYSWELALWSGAVVLLLVAGTWFFAIRQIRHHRAAFMAQGLIDGLVFQMINGLAKLRQAHSELQALNRWAKQYSKQKRETLAARNWAAGQMSFNALFMPAAQLALLGLIWYRLVEGETPAQFTLADFLSFQAAFGQFLGGVTGLTAAWTTVVAALPLFERVRPIIEAQPESVRAGVVLPDLSGRIEFENVSFRYPSAESDAVHNVSFHIRPGDYVAFVGPSGSGKSTLFRLLLGFEQPANGSVIVDGHDMSTLELSSMRRRMGVVLQNGQVFVGSIFKNIVRDTSLTPQDAWEAARAAGLYDDIYAMPMGMNTLIPEGGHGLSGGQKQRLLIARALAGKPRVLLFDEATSMLDNRTQEIVRAALRNLTSTRVLIAHRLSTVMDVDRIYVMGNGRIVESGTYDYLMNSDGVLADLARRQMV